MKDFRSITIKDITDGVGIFRATFYSYFPDKYALFDAVLNDELFYLVRGLVDNKMYKQSVELIFRYFYENKNFYQKAFQSSGQDSCAEYLKHHLYQYVQAIIGDINFNKENEISENVNSDTAFHYLAELFYTSLRFFLDQEIKDEYLEIEVERFIQMLCYGLPSFTEEDLSKNDPL